MSSSSRYLVIESDCKTTVNIHYVTTTDRKDLSLGEQEEVTRIAQERYQLTKLKFTQHSIENIKCNQILKYSGPWTFFFCVRDANTER